MDATGRIGGLGRHQDCLRATVFRRNGTVADSNNTCLSWQAQPGLGVTAGNPPAVSGRPADEQLRSRWFSRMPRVLVLIALVLGGMTTGCVENYPLPDETAPFSLVLSELLIPSVPAEGTPDPGSRSALETWGKDWAGVPGPISLNDDLVADNQMTKVFTALPSRVRQLLWMRWQQAWSKLRRSVLLQVAAEATPGVREVQLRGAVQLADAFLDGNWVSQTGLPTVRLTASARRENFEYSITAQVPASDAAQRLYLPLPAGEETLLLPVYVRYLHLSGNTDPTIVKKGLLQGVVPLPEGRIIIARWIAHLLNQELRENGTLEALLSFARELKGIPSGTSRCTNQASSCCPCTEASSEECRVTPEEILAYAPMVTGLAGDVPLPMLCDRDRCTSDPTQLGLSLAVGIQAVEATPPDDCGTSGWCVARDLFGTAELDYGNQALSGVAWGDGRLWVSGSASRIWRLEKAKWTTFTVGTSTEHGDLRSITVGHGEHVWVHGSQGLIRCPTKKGMTGMETPAAIPAGQSVTDHGSANPRSQWAVTKRGDILRMQGQDWIPAEVVPPDWSRTPGQQMRLYAIYVAPGAEEIAWVGGEQGYVARVENGRRTELQPRLSGESVKALWAFRVEGTAPQEPAHDTVYVATESGLCRVHRGQKWEPCGIPEEVRAVTSMSGSGSKDVWAVTIDGQLVHFDGLTWRVVTRMPNHLMNGTGLFLNRILAVDGTDLWAVGRWIPRSTGLSQGILLHCSRRNGAHSCVDP